MQGGGSGAATAAAATAQRRGGRRRRRGTKRKSFSDGGHLACLRLFRHLVANIVPNGRKAIL